MPTINASFARDNNRVPITYEGAVNSTTQSLTGNNATVAVPLFTYTGMIECTGLWGMVLTTLGANLTNCFWRVNDQSTQTALTLATTGTLSNLALGGQISKVALAATVLRSKVGTSAGINEITASLPVLSPFILCAKNGALSQIEFVYTTTDTPTTGTIQFFLRWMPLSADGSVTPL